MQGFSAKEEQEEADKRRRNEFAAKASNNVFQPAVTCGGYSQKEGAYYFQTIGSTVGWPQEIPIDDFMNSFEIYAVAAEQRRISKAATEQTGW